MRIKHGKAGNLADYVNVSFRMKESINYIEAVLPVPILTKEEPNRLETLRRKINRSLLVVLISFMIFLATLIGVVIDKF